MHFPHHLINFVKTLLFALLLFSFGCQKSEEPSTYDILLPQRLKDIFLFQPGSYWIMEQNAGGNLIYDSIYVTQTIHDSIDIINPGTQKPSAKKEVFEVHCFSSYNNQAFLYKTQSADLCNNLSFSEPCHFIILEQYQNNLLTASSRIYYYPDKVDGGWNANSGNTGNYIVKIDAVLENYSIGDKTYTQVRRVHTDKDRTTQNQNSIRYFASGYGMIQYSVPDLNTDWKLVRSKIVR